MKSINISPIIDHIAEVVHNHQLAPGTYKRFLEDDFPNPYGCADAANILYTIGRFPRASHERTAFIQVLQQMQDQDSGLFREKPSDPTKFVHDPIHTTAHCMAALELFDSAPLYPAKALEPYLNPQTMADFLESFDWRRMPGHPAHKGAGLYVALNLGGSDCREFNKNYFKWLWENADPDTGLWRRGCQDGQISLWHHMGMTFHFLFNLEYAHLPLRYPDKLIDSCLYMYHHVPMENFAKESRFLEGDWVYCLSRAMQQTSHRFDEVMTCLEEFAQQYITYWQNVDYATDRNINDLHELFGGVCALAELQRVLRGKLYSDIPLKLVLDRRPFI
ncbi:MAG: hypothetical protein IJ315_03175 [Firmicutes bacterium]|nr:hypothetical protein [Bacillota bacterium]